METSRPNRCCDLSKNEQSEENQSVSSSKIKNNLGRFFTLCVICCAAPYIFVTLGLMSASAAAYFGRIVEGLVVLSVLLVAAFLTWRHFKSR